MQLPCARTRPFLVGGILSLIMGIFMTCLVFVTGGPFTFYNFASLLVVVASPVFGGLFWRMRH